MSRDILWQSDNEDGTYKNPIIFADYSDPDVIRVGDTFYMTASSFNYTPGLPILTSKDLVNWALINYAVKNIDYERYTMPAHAKGIWAPAIRFHNNQFYIYYGMPDEGIFVVATDNPAGQWSEPALVLEGKGLIDPCPFWDDDGKAYVIHGYAKSRIGFKSILGMFEMSPEGFEAIGEDHFIYKGMKTQPTIEGPKVHKRNNWYYIFAPAGGVKTGWQSVLRSRTIEGPYEERIVMAQKGSITNGPHQGALVDTSANEEWFVHFQDRGIYGRITHLQPVEWREEWPIIGINSDKEGCGEPCITHNKPKGLPYTEPMYLQATDTFDNEKLGLQWQWLGNHKPEFYSLVENPGYLRLYSLNVMKSPKAYIWHSSNVLTQKIIAPGYEVVIRCCIQGLEDGEEAGCTILGGGYMSLSVKREKGIAKVVYKEAQIDGSYVNEQILMEKNLKATTSAIDFRLVQKNEIEQKIYSFYRENGGDYIDSGHTYLPSDHTWVGAKIGIFALRNQLDGPAGWADFEYVKVRLPTTK